MKQKDSYSDQHFIRNIVFGFLTSIIIIAVCLIIFALIFTLIDLPRSFASPLSAVSMVIGSFFGSFIAGKLNGEKGLKIGIICGGLLFIAIGAATLFLFTDNMFLKILVRFLCSTIPSLVGAVIGVNSVGKKKFKI